MHDDEGFAGRLRAEIRARRLAAGLSQRVLAERVSYSRAYLCKVEAGATFPPENLVEALDRELASGGTLVELRTRAWQARQAARLGLPIARHDEEASTDRRQVLELGGLAAVATLAAETSRRIATAGADPDPLAVDELETRVAALVGDYPVMPHARLTAEVTTLWQGAERALDRRLSLRVRARMVHAAGQLAYYAGRLAFNVGDDGAAAPFAALAAQHAADVGDPTLIVSVANLRSSVAYWQGRYQAALDYLGEVRRHTPPHLSARVAAYEARTYAAMGNASAALDACDRMQKAAGDFPAQPGSTPVGPAGAALFHAVVAATAGAAGKAERWARLSVSAYQPTSAEYTPEEERHALLALAAALMLRDRPDLDEAAEAARRAVRGLTCEPSRTVATRAWRVWGAFTPDQRRSPAAAALGRDLARVPLALPTGSSP